MRKIKIVSFLVLALIVLSGVFFLFRTHRHGTGTESNSAAKTIYTCPMHPSYTSDHPGNCPICGMTLVKKAVAPQAPAPAQTMAAPSATPGQDHAICLLHKCTMKNCGMKIAGNLKPGEKIICPICGQYIVATDGSLVELAASAPAIPTTTVMISPEKQQLIGVATQPVELRKMTKTIRASGKIAYDPQLAVAQEEFIQALNNQDSLTDSPLPETLARAKSMTAATEQKLKLLGMADAQIQQLAKTRKADSGLYLPTDGQHVWAYIAIYEFEIELIKPGLNAQLTALAFPGEKFAGTVISANPVIDPTTRTNLIRVEVNNPDNKLKPEMFVSAEIAVDLGEQLAVPLTAILDTGLRKIVYLSHPDGILEAREVEVGQTADGYATVVSGLNQGDIVVTSGNFLIDSESKLKGAIEPPAETHKH